MARSARLVQIDDARIEHYAIVLAKDRQTPRSLPAGAEPGHADLEHLAAASVALNAINFGSGYHDIIDKEPGLSGARTMAKRWDRYVSSTGVAVGALRAITVDDCLSIFGQDPTNTEQVELMALFAEALRQLSHFIAERYDGSFLALVEDSARSAERLAASLLAMPFYLDQTVLNDESVYFYKRAQITAADLARALPHWPPADFTDLDRLTAFADNLVPHVLMVDGLLTYDPDLTDQIGEHRLLAPGSRAEVEIRAAGVEVVERIIASLQAQGVAVRAMDVDLWLWARGGAARYKARPRHRTRGSFY